MNVIAWLLACCVYASHGRRLIGSDLPQHHSVSAKPQSSSPHRNLASMLFAMNAPSRAVRARAAGSLASPSIASSRRPSLSRAVHPCMLDVDPTYVAAGAVLLGSLGGGIALGALTEKAITKEGEDRPCVVCDGKRVIECSLCAGTGEAGYKVDEKVDLASDEIEVDTWDGRKAKVQVAGGVFLDYPIKCKDNPCLLCDGRGYTICRNCDGSGIQPRFLDRYSPEDFMD